MRAADAARSEDLPAGARRLFPFQDPTSPEVGTLICRLLEDGDSADLHWLTAALGGRDGEPALAAWLERHGARQLSRRSRAFWEVALGRRARGAAAAVAARRVLWPL